MCLYSLTHSHMYTHIHIKYTYHIYTNILKGEGAREIAQWTKPCEYEDQCLQPQNPNKSQVGLAITCKTSTQETERGMPQMKASKLKKMGSLSSEFGEVSYSNK